MKNLEAKQDRYTRGQHIQDQDGIDYLITHIDERGADLRELGNPQRTRHASYAELDNKFIVDLHEGGNAVPVDPEEKVVYINPKYLPVVIKKTGAKTREAVSEILFN